MSRWQPDARGRLEQAALELFGERGFEAVTVAEIAERAGLTERTFFRHYADKREVLFGGGKALEELLTGSVAAAPADAAPLEVVGAALAAAGAALEERRELARRRSRIIAANPELQERELIKLASWADSLRSALLARGVADPTARLAAEVGIACFRVAFERWIAPKNRRPLAELIGASLGEVASLTT